MDTPFILFPDDNKPGIFFGPIVTRLHDTTIYPDLCVLIPKIMNNERFIPKIPE